MNRKTAVLISTCSAAMAALATIPVLPALAAEPSAESAARAPVLSVPSASLHLQVPLFQSQVVSLPDAASRVSIANPDVADLVVISPMQFYVLAKDIGMTNVLVWDRSNRIVSTVDVEVTHDLGGLKSTLATLIPGNRIEVSSAQRSIIRRCGVGRRRSFEIRHLDNTALQIAELDVNGG